MSYISLFVSGLAAAGVLGGGASPVAADEVAAATIPFVSPADLKPQVERGKYWNPRTCMLAGERGVREQRWFRFRCERDERYWVLWTDR